MAFWFEYTKNDWGKLCENPLLPRLASTFSLQLCSRCVKDKKGGHLAKDKATGGLLLRESAQCPEEALRGMLAMLAIKDVSSSCVFFALLLYRMENVDHI